MKTRKRTRRIAAPLLAAAVAAAVLQGAASSAVNVTYRAHPLSVVRTTATATHPAGSGDGVDGYTPAQLRKAYGLNSISGTGKGQTIAIVESYGDPYLASDVATFDQKFGLSAPQLTIQTVGATNDAADNAADAASWAAETAMDVEWAHAMAPDAALLVIAAQTQNTDDILSAVDAATKSGAKVVSMSWGWEENQGAVIDDSRFTHSGIAYVAASGDNGAQAIWPASSPNVISTGGTTLKLGSSGTRLAEYGWYASGGGISNTESQPAWQKAMGLFASYPFRMFWRSPANVSRRLTPDVSFDADPNTGAAVYCSVAQENGGSESVGWMSMGGTSLGAPSWAGIIADLGEMGISITTPSSLYAAAGGSSYSDASGAFYDIVGGFNGYMATPGYDLVTGLGSPRADKLAAAVKAGSSSGASASVRTKSATKAAAAVKAAAAKKTPAKK